MGNENIPRVWTSRAAAAAAAIERERMLKRRERELIICTPPVRSDHTGTLNLIPFMFRLTRPLFQTLKQSTGITGLAVHPNPLPQLVKTYESTLSILSAIPQTSVYRQGTEALTRHKLNIVQAANGDIGAAEKKLNEGQIEESLDIASDELELAQKMVEWKACVPPLYSPCRSV